MIVQTQLAVKNIANPEVPPVYLAPFGEAELAKVLPIDPNSAPYELRQAVINLSRLGAASMADLISRTPVVSTFGIYSGRIKPDRFVGVVDLLPAENPGPANVEPTYTKTLQSLGVHIYSARKQGRGLGTAAVLGIMRYATQIEGTTFFDAWTSEQNLPAQRILDNLGYVETANREHAEHFGGRTSWLKQWIFAAPETVESTNTPPLLHEPLRRGYEKFTDLAMKYEVQIV